MILVISPKTIYAAKRLIEEAQQANIPLEVLSAEELAGVKFNIDINKYDCLYIRNPYINGKPDFFPQIINLAKKFHAAGKKVVDQTIVDGNLGRGKWVDYQELIEFGFPVPKTLPYSVIARSASGRRSAEALAKVDEAIFSSKGRLPRRSPPRLSLEATLSPVERSAALAARNDTVNYPLILKWIYGFKGKNIFLIHNELELAEALKKYPKDELLIQEFISAEYEYKVITVGYKSMPIVLRFAIHPQTHRPDFNNYLAIKTPTTSPRQGGVLLLEKEERLRSVADSGDNGGASPPSLRRGGRAADGVVGVNKISRLTTLAESASRLLHRELAKVDILEAKNKFYILEVNRFPGLRSFEELTGYNAIAEFIEYLK